MTSTAQPETRRKVCPKKPNTVAVLSTDNFCWECGEALVWTDAYACSCGHLLSTSDHYCPKCGLAATKPVA